MGQLVHIRERRRPSSKVFFSRSELSILLSVYSLWVSRGIWRDYAIDHKDGMAVFSIFRHTHETPLFSVAKIPGKGNKGPDYHVYQGPRRLKRSTSLSEAIQVLNQPTAIKTDSRN